MMILLMIFVSSRFRKKKSMLLLSSTTTSPIDLVAWIISLSPACRNILVELPPKHPDEIMSFIRSGPTLESVHISHQDHTVPARSHSKVPFNGRSTIDISSMMIICFQRSSLVAKPQLSGSSGLPDTSNSW